jgi:putative RecB family exonuclease
VTEYSHSRLSSFENCPRQFKYRYVDQIKVDTEGVEAFMGKRVHEILERLYHHIARNARPPSLAQVLERYRQDWERSWHDKILTVRKENPPEYYLERGVRCLENYYRGHYPFTGGETVALEERLRLRLDGDGRYKMLGIVDRIVRKAEGAFEIHDYKTSANLPPQRSVDRDRQLALYQIGLEQTYPDVKEVELVWHYLIHNKTLRSRRSPEALADLRRATMQVIDAIEAESEYRPRPGPLCRWCDYASICPEAPEAARTAAPERPGLAAQLAPEPDDDYGRQLSLLGD